MQNGLANRRQVALIVRLTLDGQGQFINGEVVSLEGIRIGRFIEWPKMMDLVQVWLADQPGVGQSSPPSDLK